MSRAADLAALIVDVTPTEAKTDELTGKTSAGSIAVTGEGGSTTTNLQQGLVKAWAQFTNSGTFTNNDSFNCSSITDLAVGAADPQYTNNFANTYYSTTTSSEKSGTYHVTMSGASNPATDHTSIVTGNAADSNIDVEFGYFMNAGDLA